MSIVYIVSAPSGSGKSTLVNELFKVVKGLDFSISYTTRPPRGSEQNGKEYSFVSKQEFEAMIAADEFLEYANVFGNYYGTARRFLREAAELASLGGLTIRTWLTDSDAAAPLLAVSIVGFPLTPVMTVLVPVLAPLPAPVIVSPLSAEPSARSSV